MGKSRSNSDDYGGFCALIILGLGLLIGAPIIVPLMLLAFLFAILGGLVCLLPLLPLLLL